MTTQQIETIAKHFVIAALWAACEEGTNPRAPKETHEKARAFVQRFTEKHANLTAEALACEGYASHQDAGSPEAAYGHDLYLTCAGYGVGFSDRLALGEVGEKLSEVIHNEWREWHIEPQFYRGWLYLSKEKEQKMPKFFVEVTDTYGGEANYSWVTRHVVSAKTLRGAVNKFSRASGISWRKSEGYGGTTRYDSVSGATCYFISEYDEHKHGRLASVNVIT